MKHLSSICLLVLLLPMPAAAYTTPGTGVVWTGDELVANSGGAVTWDDDLERYLFTEELTVSEGDSILIDEDIQCTHTTNPAINLDGYFYMGPVDSLDADSLEFFGPEDGFTNGFRVEETGELHLAMVIADGGGYDGDLPGHQMVKVVDGSATITGCRFTNWDRYVLSFGGGTGTVENCEFHDNHQWTININMSADVDISGCRLVANNLEADGAKNPISIGTQGFNVVDIDSCYISGEEGNTHGGISVWNLMGSGAEVAVHNTTVEGASYGIIANGTGVEVLITDCQFLDNDIAPNPMSGGSGITVQQNAVVNAARNLITGNHWGVTVLTGATVMLGDDDADDPDEQGHNQIHDNGNNGQTYNLYNNTSGDLLAQNNWWGSMDSTVVEDGIFHDPDDGSLGEVTYMPLWEPNANEPPEITESHPWFHMFNVHPVEEQAFSITATDPDGSDDSLAYRWYVNEELLGDEAAFSYTFEELGEFEILGVVVDVMGDSATESWTATGVNNDPRIVDHDPEELEFTETAGNTVEFSVTAEDEDEDSLSYRYLLEDEVVAEEATYSHTVASGMRSETVLCVVSDDWGGADTLRWQIQIEQSVADGEALLPDQFGIAAYPNPFNSALHVNVLLPRASQVRAVVYDVTGREVATLLQGGLAAGTHELAWNAAGAASGMYLLRVEADSEVRREKVLLVK